LRFAGADGPTLIETSVTGAVEVELVELVDVLVLVEPDPHAIAVPSKVNTTIRTNPEWKRYLALFFM